MDCGACLGWLPPFLLPRKHYTIPEVEPGIEKYVTGHLGCLKTYCTLEDLACSFETLRRWIDTFASMATELFQTARKLLAELKPNWQPEKDKRLLSAKFPATHSMPKNQNLNLLFQIFILREYFVSLVEPKHFLVWLIFVGRAKPSPTQFAAGRSRQIRNNSP